MSATPEAVPTCRGCGAELPRTLLACPACHALVHADRLKALADEATAAEAQGRPADALRLWREALELVPPDSRQARVLRERVEARIADTGSRPPPEVANRAGVLGALGVMIWKLKWLLGFVFTNGKLAIFGLGKVSTLLSMLAAVWVYALLWGWRFGLGFVLSIYVHELGHVAALRRLGMRADAPVFVPGLGAFVRLRQRPDSPEEDAEIGLAGPVAGLLAAGTCLAVGHLIDSDLWLALARVGAWINLFNLLPVWQLDGGRGFAALGKAGRVGLAALALGLALATGEGLLLLLGVLAGVRAFERGTRPGVGWTPAAATFAVLVVALGLMAMVEPTLPAGVAAP